MTADEEARAVLDHLHATAAIVVPDGPAPDGAPLHERVQAARWTIERRTSLVDHLTAALAEWRGLYDQT